MKRTRKHSTAVLSCGSAWGQPVMILKVRLADGTDFRLSFTGTTFAVRTPREVPVHTMNRLASVLSRGLQQVKEPKVVLTTLRTAAKDSRNLREFMSRSRWSRYDYAPVGR